MEGFTNLFVDSQSTGKLANFAITDFGKQINKAKVSFGNVSLGIYRQGSKKSQKAIFHDQQSEKEIYDLVAKLKYKGNYYASLRNFYGTNLMNFTQEDIDKGLYFYTFTLNSFQKEMVFSLAPWNKDKTCPLPDCDDNHYYQKISIMLTWTVNIKFPREKLTTLLIKLIYTFVVCNLKKIAKTTKELRIFVR